MLLGYVCSYSVPYSLVYGQSKVKIDSSSFVDVRVPLDENIQKYANDPSSNT